MLVDGLKHNLLSISQLCDKGFKIKFTKSCCLFVHDEKKECMFKGLRVNNIYMLSLDDVAIGGAKCLSTMNENSWLWHRRLAHLNFDLLNKVSSKDFEGSFVLVGINFGKTN